MDTNPDPTPANQPEVARKKGIPPLAWVGMGCGGLLLVALIAGILAVKAFKGKIDEFVANPEKAMAEQVVSMSPDLELVSQDEAAGEMTIRNEKGEELTLSYGDIAEGKFTVKDEDGNVATIGSSDLSKIPEWVPLPPDFSDAVNTFHTENGDEIAGQVSGKTSLSVEQAEEFIQTGFSKSAATAGVTMSTSSKTSLSTGGATVDTLKYKAGRRSLEVVISRKEGKRSSLNLHYSEKK